MPSDRTLPPASHATVAAPTTMTGVVKGQHIRIGSGFSAFHFGEDMFSGLIDPVVMVDHFEMTIPTFDPHPHAGISAVTYMFEDSTAPHVNYDSLGNHIPIEPGALHWLAAGRGAIHTEQPEGANPRVHALQIFVNLAADRKAIDPFAVHIEPQDIPELHGPGLRVRVVLGETSGIRQPATQALPEPFTLLDGFLSSNESFHHVVPAGWNAMVCLIDGQLTVDFGGRAIDLAPGEAIGVGRGPETDDGEGDLRLLADPTCHFVILSGRALKEPIVKNGPFVMNSREQMLATMTDYRLGHFGQLVMP